MEKDIDKKIADLIYDNKVEEGWRNVSTEDCLREAIKFLRTYELVKNNVALGDVVGRSEQLSLCKCDKPSPDIMYGKICTECCLDINPKA